MDDTICNFKKAFLKNWTPLLTYPQSQWGFFLNLEPIPDALESYKKLGEFYDMWILTRPSVPNPLCYTEKRVWIEKHLGIETCDRLIISPDKTLFKGDYLIDDNIHKGFEGEMIQIGTPDFPDWKTITNYLLNKLQQ